MGKMYNDIVKWGKIKPFFNTSYDFNSIDIETVDNQLFLFGYIKDDNYYSYEGNFYKVLHDLIIDSIQSDKDIVTWSRYDNTHLLKLILQDVKNVNFILNLVGKISPIYEYQYQDFKISIENIIKDSMIFKVTDKNDKSRTCTLYNLKNLYHTDLETTAKNYKIDYYSKIGIEYHIIDKERYLNDLAYKTKVLESNYLDNKVIIDIAYQMLENFKSIAKGYLPKTIFTNGSIARSYLLAYLGHSNANLLNFKSIFKNSRLQQQLLKYSMLSYHGGKIESYVLGYIKEAKITDKTSAYPYAMSLLERLTGRVIYDTRVEVLERYFYAFIRCDIEIKDPNFIHPLVVENPINKSNISPYGYIKDIVITKIEYDYLIKHGQYVMIHNFIACESVKEYPYKNMIDELFNNRMLTSKTNKSLSEMYKTIINSLYGITYELTDMYVLNTKDEIEWVGYRAGDYFNSVIASYITSYMRTDLSEVSNNIVENGGEVYLNMTDSIIYNGDITLDIFTEKKTLGAYEMPTEIKDLMILGAGRYEYKDSFTEKYTIKNRGFSVSIKDKSFYKDLDLSDEVHIPHRTFVTSFKATTKKYSYEKMGYLIDDTYKINPFNLGGKRIILDYKVNLNKNYTKTLPVELEKNAPV